MPLDDAPQATRTFKTYKFRLYPKDEQKTRLEQWFAAVRWIYNAALEQRRTYGRKSGTDLHGRPSVFKGCGKQSDGVIIQDSQVGWRQLADDPDLAWLTDLPSVCRQIALQDLDKAFQAFFKGQRGYPGYRSASANNSVRFQCWAGGHAAVMFGKDSVRIPRLGRIRYRCHVKPYGRFGQASITREGNRYFVCLTTDHGERAVAPDASSAVGVVLAGVTAPLMLSDGRYMPPDDEQAVLLERAKDAQRKLDRSMRGSGRRRRRVETLAAIARLSAARRKSLAHEVTTEIARTYSVIVVEDLKVRELTESARGDRRNPGKNVKEKAEANRAILNVAPYQMRQMLEYKSARRGGVVLAVDPERIRQTCSACGTVSSEHDRLQPEFVCGDCGHRQNADLNAARNVLFAGVPGATGGSREASGDTGDETAAPKSVASSTGPDASCAEGEAGSGGNTARPRSILRHLRDTE